MVHPVRIHMFPAMRNPRGHGHSRCLAKGEVLDRCQKLISRHCNLRSHPDPIALRNVFLADNESRRSPAKSNEMEDRSFIFIYRAFKRQVNGMT